MHQRDIDKNNLVFIIFVSNIGRAYDVERKAALVKERDEQVRVPPPMFFAKNKITLQIISFY